MDRMLQGCTLFIELDDNAQLSGKLVEFAACCGAAVLGDFSHEATHVLVSHMEQPVAQQALEANVPLVNADWLYESIEQGAPIADITQVYMPYPAHAIPGFEQYLFCATGFEGVFRQLMLHQMACTGARVTKNMPRETTHLLVADPHANSDKIAYARSLWVERGVGPHIVTAAWLEACLREWRHVPETQEFHVQRGGMHSLARQMAVAMSPAPHIKPEPWVDGAAVTGVVGNGHGNTTQQQQQHLRSGRVTPDSGVADSVCGLSGIPARAMTASGLHSTAAATAAGSSAADDTAAAAAATAQAATPAAAASDPVRAVLESTEDLAAQPAPTTAPATAPTTTAFAAPSSDPAHAPSQQPACEGSELLSTERIPSTGRGGGATQNHYGMGSVGPTGYTDTGTGQVTEMVTEPVQPPAATATQVLHPPASQPEQVPVTEPLQPQQPSQQLQGQAAAAETQPELLPLGPSQAANTAAAAVAEAVVAPQSRPGSAEAAGVTGVTLPGHHTSSQAAALAAAGCDGTTGSHDAAVQDQAQANAASEPETRGVNSVEQVALGLGEQATPASPAMPTLAQAAGRELQTVADQQPGSTAELQPAPAAEQPAAAAPDRSRTPTPEPEPDHTTTAPVQPSQPATAQDTMPGPATADQRPDAPAAPQADAGSPAADLPPAAQPTAPAAAAEEAEQQQQQGPAAAAADQGLTFRPHADRGSGQGRPGTVHADAAAAARESQEGQGLQRRPSGPAAGVPPRPQSQPASGLSLPASSNPSFMLLSNGSQLLHMSSTQMDEMGWMLAGQLAGQLADGAGAAAALPAVSDGGPAGATSPAAAVVTAGDAQAARTSAADAAVAQPAAAPAATRAAAAAAAAAPAAAAGRVFALHKPVAASSGSDSDSHSRDSSSSSSDESEASESESESEAGDKGTAAKPTAAGKRAVRGRKAYPDKQPSAGADAGRKTTRQSGKGTAAKQPRGRQRGKAAAASPAAKDAVAAADTDSGSSDSEAPSTTTASPADVAAGAAAAADTAAAAVRPAARRRSLRTAPRLDSSPERTASSPRPVQPATRRRSTRTGQDAATAAHDAAADSDSPAAEAGPASAAKTAAGSGRKTAAAAAAAAAAAPADGKAAAAVGSRRRSGRAAAGSTDQPSRRRSPRAAVQSPAGHEAAVQGAGTRGRRASAAAAQPAPAAGTGTYTGVRKRGRSPTPEANVSPHTGPATRSTRNTPVSGDAHPEPPQPAPQSGRKSGHVAAAPMPAADDARPAKRAKQAAAASGRRRQSARLSAAHESDASDAGEGEAPPPPPQQQLQPEQPAASPSPHRRAGGRVTRPGRASGTAAAVAAAAPTTAAEQGDNAGKPSQKRARKSVTAEQPANDEPPTATAAAPPPVPAAAAKHKRSKASAAGPAARRPRAQASDAAAGTSSSRGGADGGDASLGGSSGAEGTKGVRTSTRRVVPGSGSVSHKYAVTSISDKDRALAQLKRLGVDVALGNDWVPGTTHLLLGNPPTHRSFKAVCGMAAGNWLIEGHRYLEASVRSGVMCAPTEYELQEGPGIERGAPRHWRERRTRTGCGAFDGLWAIILGSPPSPLDVSALKLILTAGGGRASAVAANSTRSLEMLLSSHPRPQLLIAGPNAPPAMLAMCEAAGVTCVTPQYLVDWVCSPWTSPLSSQLYLGHCAKTGPLDALRVLETRRGGVESAGPEDSC